MDVSLGAALAPLTEKELSIPQTYLMPLKCLAEP